MSNVEESYQTYTNEGDRVDKTLNQECVARHSGEADCRATLRCLFAEESKENKVDNGRNAGVWVEILSLSTGKV